MRVLLLVFLLVLPACAASAEPKARLIQRAKDVVERCALSESCAQRSDQNAHGYRACGANRLVVQSTAWVDHARLAVTFSCDAGDDFLFQVVVHGLTGPAFEEVVQCERSGCPLPSQAFPAVL